MIRTIITDDPACLRQRTLETPDPALLGRMVDLADRRDNCVVARARIAALDDRGIKLSNLESIPENRQFTVATGQALQTWAGHTEADTGKFTQHAVRPKQAQFRKALLKAYGGRCAFTGCDVEEALDAAHLVSWRIGNEVNDGILARLDIHRLLDRGVIQVAADGRINVAPEARGHYGDLHGRKIRLPDNEGDRPRLQRQAGDAGRNGRRPRVRSV